MPGPCSAPNGDISLTFITEGDKQDSAECPKRAPREAWEFLYSRRQRGTGKTAKKNK